MESKVIKIGFENYQWLAMLAAKIQQQEARPISFDETITTLKEEHEKVSAELRQEIKVWEQAGLQDSIAFWKKHKL